MAQTENVDPLSGLQKNYCSASANDLSFKRIAGVVFGRFQAQSGIADTGWLTVPFLVNGGIGEIRGAGNLYGYWRLNGAPPGWLCRAYVP